MTTPTALPNDLIWGVRSIARYINRSVRTTYYLIEKGMVPAKKLGSRTIVARASEIDRAFSNDGASTNNEAIPRDESKVSENQAHKRSGRAR